jgi:hypothetical protein
VELSRHLLLAGRITLALGALAVVRIAIEWGLTRRLNPVATYDHVVALEFGLALLAVLAGIGLHRRRPWSLPVATLVAAVGFVDGVAGLLVIGRNLSGLVASLGLEGIGALYGSRVLLTFLLALWWPTLLFLIYLEVLRPDPDDPRGRAMRRMFWIIGASSTVATGPAQAHPHLPPLNP